MLDNKKEGPEPQPLLLNPLMNQDSHRAGLKSATYRSVDVRSRKRISGEPEVELNDRITNQLKRIVPGDLGHKSQKSMNLNNRQNYLHTQTSGDFIKECPDYPPGASNNPEVLDRLDELSQKINLIEYRQKKMQARSRYSSNKDEGDPIKTSRVVKAPAKHSVASLNDVSKEVIKELRTVRDDIQELKEIVFTIKEEKAEEQLRTNRIKNSEDRTPGINKLLNSVPLKITSIHEAIPSRKFLHTSAEKRTVYYNDKLESAASQKNIYLNSRQLGEEIEFEVKPLKKRGKSRPMVSSNISLVPRGLSKKSIRARTAVKKESSSSPYNHDMIRVKSKSHVGKQAQRRISKEDQISFIEENFESEELKRNMLIFPRLPAGINPLTNSEELLELAKQVLTLFKVKTNWAQPINIKKYKNCVFIGHLGSNILWSYDGKFYIGGWSSEGEGRKEGQGIEFVPEKYIYEGRFWKGKRHGPGVMTSHNGENYTGDWANGYRHGKGKLEEGTGCVYEGEWLQGKKEGYGKIKYSKKEFYEGLFKDGLKHGLGKEVFKNGDYFQGEYVNGKLQGNGIYRWANGASYNGQFKEGFRHGRGTWSSNNCSTCDVYEGQYKYDNKSGRGKYNWANGSVYIGMFQNDQKNGEGTVYYNDGKILQAMWENGQIAKKLYSEKPKTAGKR